MRPDGRKPHARHCIRSTEEEVELARYALIQLKTTVRQVGLLPAPEPRYKGHKIRVLYQSNPAWYSAMAQRRGFNRRKSAKRYGPLRQYVIRALERIISGWKDPAGLEDEILSEYRDYLEEQKREYRHR